MTQQDLEALFSPYGRIITSRILCDNITGKQIHIVLNFKYFDSLFQWEILFVRPTEIRYHELSTLRIVIFHQSRTCWSCRGSWTPVRVTFLSTNLNLVPRVLVQ